MMKNLMNRFAALLLAMLLVLSVPVVSQAVSLLDLSDLYNNGQSSDSLIDTEEDTPTATPVPASTAAPAAEENTAASISDKHIRDDANLLTAEEESSILERISTFQKNTGMDFAVMTANKPHEGYSAQAIADDYYDYNQFGLDDENSGVAYFIDMAERYHYLSTTGHMIDVMTDSRIDSVISNNTRYLSGKQYYAAVINMIDMVESYYRKGIPEGQYQYDVLTGQVLTARHKALTSNELLVSGVIALIVAFIFYKGVHHTYELKGNTYSYDVNSNSQLNMTDTEDTYTHTTTTRVRKPDPPRSSGGGFSGGGGSGVHIGSSGSSHGGGGGRF